MTKLLVCLPFVFAACKSDPPAKPAPTPAGPRFEIAVTEQGFEPADVTVPSGKPVTLVFARKTDQTCAKSIVVETGDGNVEKELPLDTPVEIATTFPKSGRLAYACTMNMLKGTITVR